MSHHPEGEGTTLTEEEGERRTTRIKEDKMTAPRKKGEETKQHHTEGEGTAAAPLGGGGRHRPKGGG